jgi:carboxymethylenebutenolidase
LGAHVTIETGSGERFAAYHAVPAQPNGGGVVVLQEIFGINANIRGIADQFAAAGYHAIAADLFWRQEHGVELDPGSESDRGRATELLKGLDQPLAVQDALAAAEYLRAQPGANGRIGAVGYCLGGKLAYLMAMQPGVDAAVSYYGVAIQAALDAMHRVRCPLLLHLAVEDHLCPPEAQAAIEAAAASHDLVTVMRYPGVGHAFARRGGSGFDAASAERADAATFALLAAEVA